MNNFKSVIEKTTILRDKENNQLYFSLSRRLKEIALRYIHSNKNFNFRAIAFEGNLDMQIKKQIVEFKFNLLEFSIFLIYKKYSWPQIGRKKLKNYELHVHHIDGVKSNNRPSNLEVVCVKCHSKKPMHQHMLTNPKFMKYL